MQKLKVHPRTKRLGDAGDTICALFSSFIRDNHDSLCSRYAMAFPGSDVPRVPVVEVILAETTDVINQLGNKKSAKG